VRTPAGDVPSDGRPAGPDTRHASAA
jgi:hypothetical protein